MSKEGISVAESRWVKLLTRGIDRLMYQGAVATIGIPILGMVIDIWHPESNAFARSGSVLIAFGVFQIVRWRMAVFESIERLQIAQFGISFGATLKRMRRDKETSAEAHAKSASEYANERLRGVKPEIETRERMLWFVEGAMLIVGTIVSGFGDLLTYE